jgi:hypothetical protein
VFVISESPPHAVDPFYPHADIVSSACKSKDGAPNIWLQAAAFRIVAYIIAAIRVAQKWCGTVLTSSGQASFNEPLRNMPVHTVKTSCEQTTNINIAAQVS